ncbi:MAG: polysaccharide biosynthesis tyrosine autokinase, partial [Syntrophales bacterium]|nr:polysaccharide biosynthesis tyrosine autokinase [Syntrophales bacterium]
FRKLRTIILHRPEPCRVILVTSALESEGKSMIAANLASVLAKDLNRHALLVEADLRNPSLSAWFGLSNGRGLSDYLSGEEDLPGLMAKTSIPKLSIIAGGRVPENPVELIGSLKMEKLLKELKSRYSDRFIIIDSPPLLVTSETNVISRHVDGIIFVVRAGKVPREMIQGAIATLPGEKMLGIVMNDVFFMSAALHSRYFGSSSYYHQSDRKKYAGPVWKRLLDRIPSRAGR